MAEAPAGALPPRFARPGPLAFVLYVVAAGFFVLSVQHVGFSLSELVSGLPGFARVLGEMFPPSTERLLPIGAAILETFQMALVGTAVGVLLSLPLAVAASRMQSPHPLVYHAARQLVSLFRTVPDLIWALLFVASVGLGPFAGTLAIVVDTMGFCGRFFAEAMEEVDHGPQEALRAMGASRMNVLACAVLPAAAPSIVNTALFNLEKATRASVIIGLVGAGGIGIELKVAMDMFRYGQAATIILAIFLLVILVEQGSARIRRHLM
jgi:phosphonate transport system permease protein